MIEFTMKTNSSGDNVVLADGQEMSTMGVIFALREGESVKKENEALREFKEKVNKELRLWYLEACDRDSSEKALNNIEDMILEGGER